MNESTRKKVMYGILVAAILFGIYNFMQPSQKRVQQTADQQTPTQDSLAAMQTVKTIDVEKKRAESWGRDPFRSGTSSATPVVHAPAQKPNQPAAAPMPVWRLSGIIFNTRQPLALINGRMVTVGDQVDQARVSRIEQTKVTIIYNGTPIDLRVSKG